MMEFHISRDSRVRYGVSDVLFNFAGNVVFADVGASRQLASRMNEVRGSADDPERAVNPGSLFAMGLIDELSHVLVEHYRKQRDPGVIRDALQWFGSRVGGEEVDKLLRTFVQEFPSVVVFRGDQTVDEWLKGETDGLSHQEAAMEELVLLWLANVNPAFKPFSELFDDSRLKESTAYKTVTAEFGPYFATKPALTIRGKKMNLLEALRAPALASPDSLSGQLDYMLESWPEFIGESLRKLLLAVDVLKEEERAIWMRFHPPSESERRRQRQWQGWMSGRGQVPTFSAADREYEAFSQDVEWMPTVVMIAKSTFVWLAQLTKQYGRTIERLDQIPDEELRTLSERGMNALWLIGVWERSRASKTIKRLCGQQDAVASAYSLMSYSVAPELGGEASYRDLRDRAARYGIRLASDMVPNHMGIDSNWVIEHPEWFLQRGDSPYPSYRFEGPDLSHDGRVEIKIDDHYYEQSDAAVVFRRRDKWTGSVQYIYHGNDGTSFPWNDTAQLNYLSAQVREQVIQTILYVARLFPIIRFDAAMTLARRHVQRLWFPLPGSGGAIPSRAESSMTQEEFDRAMPKEFWREVVDRVAVEVPGTLLLAEAFWLMEGYFVRTLGMHRVYNSAFMVMLRDEDNANYRSVLKNTLEFDPDIMKRYVNFMSNPDERTAIDQFGTGDKYFGVCTMMATLPGLPMFGHGQVEAFTEKYGMEYYRPRYDETPNWDLVARHQREIAPLLKKRALFAESSNFLLYDFWTESGTVDENVFAYSNYHGGDRALVLFNNRYGETRGTVKRSAAYADKGSGSLRQRELGEGIGLPWDGSLFFGFEDTSTRLKYLRRSTELVERGFTVSLRAYGYTVLLNWRELRATEEQPWDKLCDVLNGTGVNDLDEALAKWKLRPVHDALRRALDPTLVRAIAEIAELEVVETERDAHVLQASPREKERDDFLRTFAARGEMFIREALAAATKPVSQTEESSVSSTRRVSSANGSGATREQGQSEQQTRPSDSAVPATGGSLVTPSNAGERRTSDLLYDCVSAALRLPALEMRAPKWPVDARRVLPSRSPGSSASGVWGAVLAWCLVRALTQSHSKGAKNGAAARLFDELLLRSALAEIFGSLGLHGQDTWEAAARLRIQLLAEEETDRSMVAGLPRRIWDNEDARWLMDVHKSEGSTYFRKEGHERLVWAVQLHSLLQVAEVNGTDSAEQVASITRAAERGVQQAKDAGYRLDLLIAEAGGTQTDSGPASVSEVLQDQIDKIDPTEAALVSDDEGDEEAAGETRLEESAG